MQHVADLAGELILAVGKAAVFDRALHVCGQVFAGDKHCGGGAHGFADDHDLRVGIERNDILDPCDHVVPLKVTHGAVVLRALSVAAHIREKAVVTHLVKTDGLLRHAARAGRISVHHHGPQMALFGLADDLGNQRFALAVDEPGLSQIGGDVPVVRLAEVLIIEVFLHVVIFVEDLFGLEVQIPPAGECAFVNQSACRNIRAGGCRGGDACAFQNLFNACHT